MIQGAMVLKVPMELRVIEEKRQVIKCIKMIANYEMHCVGFKRYGR